MASRSERDVILDHALRDEENLEIALKIGAAFDDLRNRLIVQFLEKVDRELSAHLGQSWQIRVCHDTLKVPGNLEFLSAHYSGHPGKFRIVLAGGHFPPPIWFAVQAENAPALHEQVRKALDQDFAKGKVDPTAFWWHPVDKAYSDWSSEDGMLLLYHKVEAADYFIGNLQMLAKTIEHAIISSTASVAKA